MISRVSDEMIFGMFPAPNTDSQNGNELVKENTTKSTTRTLTGLLDRMTRDLGAIDDDDATGLPLLLLAMPEPPTLPAVPPLPLPLLLLLLARGEPPLDNGELFRAMLALRDDETITVLGESPLLPPPVLPLPIGESPPPPPLPMMVGFFLMPVVEVTGDAGDDDCCCCSVCCR